ncbi:hypothetical protein, partial [Xanthobacter sp.]|uniref:hypothetical protein n=1 Tax=Xanthobacter sp. TaxID=35809 RepID=UPI0025E81B33
ASAGARHGFPCRAYRLLTEMAELLPVSRKRPEGRLLTIRFYWEKLERAMGFEPTTPTLARLLPKFYGVSRGFLMMQKSL